MITNLTSQNLIDFENDICKCFENKQIRAPIHIDNGNENELIKVFQDIKENDWIFCNWRSHYKMLLKGVPPLKLKQAILNGKSISLCFPEHRAFSSAIVAGSLPIAVGVAMSIKQKGDTNKVYVFVGDMGAETGMMWECFKYSFNNHLPIKFIIEDNNKSVMTNTRRTWGKDILTFDGMNSEMVYHFKYSSKFPHAGTLGGRVQF